MTTDTTATEEVLREIITILAGKLEKIRELTTNTIHIPAEEIVKILDGEQ